MEEILSSPTAPGAGPQAARSRRIWAQVSRASRSNTIFFPTGGAKLTPENEAYLDRVADYLIKHEKAELELRGYSDSVGSWSVNLRLSGVRCGVVRDHLVARGVENWRLTLEAFGEADPIASNSTSRGRAMNRRVELIPIR